MKKNLLLFEMVLKERQRFKKVNSYRYIQFNLLQGMKVLLKVFPTTKEKAKFIECEANISFFFADLLEHDYL